MVAEENVIIEKADASSIVLVCGASAFPEPKFLWTRKTAGKDSKEEIGLFLFALFWHCIIIKKQNVASTNRIRIALLYLKNGIKDEANSPWIFMSAYRNWDIGC